MTAHTERLLRRILEACDWFDAGQLSIEKLCGIAEANTNAIDEPGWDEFRMGIQDFGNRVEDAAYIFDESEKPQRSKDAGDQLRQLLAKHGMMKGDTTL